MFRAAAHGKALVFDTNGVIGGKEVFKDRDTGSRWQQSSLAAISGPLKGTHLALYPFLLTTWDEWRKQHADTLVLKPLPGYANPLVDMNKIINQGIMGLAGPAPKGAFSRDNRLRPRDTIAGLETEGEAKAYPMSALRRARVVNDMVGGIPVLLVHQPDSDMTTAFVAQVGGKRLKFQAADPEADKLVDLEAHSIWTPMGSASKDL